MILVSVYKSLATYTSVIYTDSGYFSFLSFFFFFHLKENLTGIHPQIQGPVYMTLNAPLSNTFCITCIHDRI
jgi:hypothetical protein